MKLTPIKTLFALFFPMFLATSLQQLSLTMDSVMINQYTAEGAQAIGIASSVTTIIQPVFFAIATGVNSFSVQYYALNKKHELKQLMGIAVSIICPVVIGCFLVFLFFENDIIGSLVDINTSVGQLTLDYFSIIKWVIFLSPFEILFTNQYRAIKKPHVPLVIGFIQMVINFIFNIILIYGVGGYLELGIVGAALATLISKLAYILITYLYSIKIKSPFIGSVKEMFSFEFGFLKKVVIITLPLVIVEFMFGLSKFIYTKIFLITGALGYGAYIVAQRISMTFNGLVMAPAQVSGIVMGEKIVSRDNNLIHQQLKTLIKFIAIVGLSLLTITLFVMPNSIGLFNVTDNNMIALIKQLVIINGIYMILRIPVASMIATLKSGGDNRFVILLDAGISFIFTIPVMYFLAIKGVGVIGLSLVMVGDMIIKIIIGTIRIKTDRWKNVL